MKKDANDTRTTRRRFLAGLTAVGGIAATNSALSLDSSQLVPTTPDIDDDRPHGYRETDHVRAYYRAARD